MTNPLPRALAALGAAALIAAPAAAVAAPRTVAPAVTYKWQNTTSLGCVKDEGVGQVFEVVANCSIASNFTRLYGQDVDGIGFYVYKDGSGNCIKLVSGFYLAEACANNGAEHLSDPDPEVIDLGDVDNGVNKLMTDYTGGDLIDFFPGAAGQGWELS